MASMGPFDISTPHENPDGAIDSCVIIPHHPVQSGHEAEHEMSPVTIRDIRVILTEPDDIRLVIVKVETSEPGLYGLGCATFTMRPAAVVAAIEDYLRPFLIGRDVADIEDIWQSSYVSSYWRNGPVLNNALGGIDMALWDVKGKMAGMPVYDLLGGKAREAAAVYVHASGDVPEAVEEAVRRFMEDGFHHVRVQVDTPGFEFNMARESGPRNPIWIMAA